MWRMANNALNAPGVAQFQMHWSDVSVLISHVYADGILIRYGTAWSGSPEGAPLLSGLQEICMAAARQMASSGYGVDVDNVPWTIADRIASARCVGIAYCSGDFLGEMREHGIYTITPDIPTLVGGDLVINEFDLTKFNLRNQLDAETGMAFRSQLEARGIKF
jgi:hypothetical protein